MQIELHNLGKRYNREWIFRGITFIFEKGEKYAITGNNGSGKSTLLQIICGAIMHSEGEIKYYSKKNNLILHKKPYEQISVAAPYLELIEEMTASEFLRFHSVFKKTIRKSDEILEYAGLKNAADKQIRYFSSGMKQRLKLAQAFFSHTEVILLDEPTTNLDEEGIQLYKSLVKNHTEDRVFIVSSNDPHEYDFCNEIIQISQFK
ncbi:MAG: ABC transporter ATP-binding protein [Ferruginibacter sp.]|nr:ABC transporter ATP-binding protein [Ferruginibacter sp.]